MPPHGYSEAISGAGHPRRDARHGGHGLQDRAGTGAEGPVAPPCPSTALTPPSHHHLNDRVDVGERLAGGDGDVAPNAARGVEQRHVEFESVFPHVATMPRRDGVRWRMFVQGQILRTGGEVPMERQTLLFVMERETKNTVRFQEEANGKPPRGRHAVCAAMGARATATAAADRDD